MNGPRPRSTAGAIAIAALLATTWVRAQEGQAVAVEPGDLKTRPNLIGREVVVDDLVSRFQYHPETGFDQIFLKRAPDVAFDLPPRLRPTQNPTVVGFKVRGVLRHEG